MLNAQLCRLRKIVIVIAAAIVVSLVVIIFVCTPDVDPYQTCTVFESPIYWRSSAVKVVREQVSLCPNEYVESSGTFRVRARLRRPSLSLTRDCN